jgi:hypothetical protein
LKVLLDECTPSVIKARLRSHEIQTVQDMGWAGVKNGELLSLAERERFDVLVTTDQNLRHQQDLSKRSLGVMVLPSNQVPVVVKLLPEIEKILPTLTRGSVVELQLPP